MSQRELAARAGTSAAAICRYERGDRVPRVDTLTRVLAAAGVAWGSAEATPTGVDVEANARALEELLALADVLPRRAGRALEAPIMRDLVRARAAGA